MSTLTLICALPLLGFVVNGLLGSRLPRSIVATLACALPAVSFALTVWAFLTLQASGPLTETLYAWAALPDFTVEVALYFDQLTAVMCLVVTGIGTLIHVYSIGYMAHDRGFARYFAYLNLFLFFMLVLVLAKNLLVLFVGWEGVGLASYLLIGFWFEDRAKTAAGLKAFVVNRVGDTGFVLAAFLLYGLVGSLDFQVIDGFFTAHASPGALTTVIGLLLLLGACGKSAQIPLHVWLPDAMAGPTPVSALIHAATMVTAGVYLIARLGALYLDAPTAMAITAWIGAATALLGATLAVTQFNLKKVLAYSTVSQIGLMILACGVGAFQAAMFHLVTHAFFKACLFLGAGAVLHALQGEEDMRKMGALARRLPFTFATFLVATLALCGIPPFAGFFSKDEILWQAFSAPQGSILLWIVALAASSLTAFYMFRAVYLTFFGTSRVAPDVASHVHEPPASMATVLAVLALGALGIGFIGLPAIWAHLLGVGSPLQTFLAPALASAATSAGHHAASTEWLLMAIAVLAAIGGITVAWFLFGRGTAPDASIVEESRGLSFDRVYEHGIVRGIDWISASVLARGVEAPLARLMLRSADGARRASRVFVRLQTGNVQAYAFYAVAGLAIVLWWGALHD